jgi:vacuolar-type H+-ATPase subunit E/Vma4
VTATAGQTDQASGRTHAALEPLRAALLTGADAQARAVEAASEAESRELLASARRRRDAVLQDARARGEAEGSLRVRSERARVQREARGLVLAAQRAAYDDLRARARTAVRELLEDPAERQRLAASLRSRLGPDAVVRAHGGGLVGESADGRVVDASVEALVDAAVASVDLQHLWAPA